MAHFQEQQPYLRMWSPSFTELPLPDLPCGYVLRQYQPGDEQLWVAVLQSNGELGEWNTERAQQSFSGENGRVWLESIHMVMHADKPVATACVQLHNAHPDLPELGWVAVVPEEQGHHLGRAVSLAVLHFMRQHAYTRCFLQTNDWRLPAIKTYLDLRFIPDLTHESYPDRWKAIRAALNSYVANQGIDGK